MEVHTRAVTVGFTFEAGDHTFALGADLTGGTGCSTSSTVGAIRLEVHTRATTLGFSCQTGDDTGAALTDLSGRTGFGARATIGAVGL